MTDYNSWKDRIQTHMEGMEGGIWDAVCKIYVKPINESNGLHMPLNLMNNEQRKAYNVEKKGI